MAFPAAILGMLARSPAILARLVMLPGAALNRRRILGQLDQFDDRMLRDIGLTRQDVVCAAAEPLFRDPSIGLRYRADERRAAWRATSRERQDLRALMRNWADERRAALRSA